VDAGTTLINTLTELGSSAILLYLVLNLLSYNRTERDKHTQRLDAEVREHINDLKECAGLSPHIVAMSRVIPHNPDKIQD
jgi:hypothetical protein